MTHNEVVNKLDECLAMFQYYIPRITNEENKKYWVDNRFKYAIEWQIALLIGREGWEETQERRDVIGQAVQGWIDRMNLDLVKGTRK